MFQFSEVLKKKEDLEQWEKWFESRGIQTKIRKNEKGFALWREGEEAHIHPPWSKGLKK